MKQTQDPTERFLVSAFATLFRAFMTPCYYMIRSDMGVQYSGLIPIALSIVVYAVLARLFAIYSEIDASSVKLCLLLFALGYLRNTFQSRFRRRTRDWSVHRWSTGVSLLKPVLQVAHFHLGRRWRGASWLGRVFRVLLKSDFIYFVAEPVMLVVGAVAFYSIGSLMSWYL